MMGLIREPLVHFVVLGALIFGVFAWVADPQVEPTERRIVVDDDAAARIAQRFEASWKRPPTESELAALIDSQIEEDILVREALLLGLDRDDAVVRQRLALKMRFLLETGADGMEPTDADLEAHLSSRAERFLRPGMITFEQVLLPQDVPAPGDTLMELKAGADPERIGAPTLLPTKMEEVSERAIDNVFGEGFFSQLAALPIGSWEGPARSAYGVHLVRVTDLRAPVLPAIEDVREALVSDWHATKAQELYAERIAALRAQYDIQLPGGEEDPA